LRVLRVDHQGPGDIKHFVHHPDAKYLSDYHIPILRGPPANTNLI
jgi:hypothetical protein